MEKILYKKKVVAIKISSIASGSIPVTSPTEALQVLTLKHSKGRLVSPHSHPPYRRETDNLEECLVVVRGKIRVFFFDEKANEFARLDIAQGEACIILSGPHGVEFLEDSEVIEIKNGPFIDDRKPLV